MVSPTRCWASGPLPCDPGRYLAVKTHDENYSNPVGAEDDNKSQNAEDCNTRLDSSSRLLHLASAGGGALPISPFWVLLWSFSRFSA